MKHISLTARVLGKKPALKAMAALYLGLAFTAPLQASVEELAPTAPVYQPLKSSITVNESTITLADIFGDILPKDFQAAYQPVMQAPQPGREMRLNMGRIAQFARQYDIDWQSPMNNFSMTVKRSGVQITQDFVEGLLDKTIVSEGLEGDYKVNLRGLQRGVYIPTNRMSGESYLSQFNKRDNSDSFSVTLNIPAGSSDYDQVRLFGTLVKMIEVPVLGSNILRDQVIRERDVTYKQVPAKRLRNSVIDPRQLIGKAAVRTLRADTMINARDIQEPIMVRKGDEIYVVLKTGLLSIQMRAVAEQDGAIGDTIDIKNLSSGRLIKAVVTGSKAVRVNPAQSLQTASR